MSLDFEKREKQRNQLRDYIIDFYNKGEVDKVKELTGVLVNELPYTFQELPFNPSYTSALKENYFSETGEEFTGNVQDLIEEDFEYWNQVDSSLVYGGKEIVGTLMNRDEKQRANMLTRLNTYDSVSGFGEGSRDLWEQVKSTMTGVGYDVAATFGAGVIPKLGQKLFAKDLTLNALKSQLKRMNPRAKAAALAGSYGGLSDIERQALEMIIGGRESYSPTQTGVSATLGAVSPMAGEVVGKTVVGPTMRTLQRPLESASTVVKTLAPGYSSRSVARGITTQTGERVGAKGESIISGSQQLQQNLSNSLQQTNKFFNNNFDNFKLEGVDAADVANVYKLWQKTPGLRKQIPPILKDKIGAFEKGSVPSVEMLRDLKREIFSLQQRVDSPSEKDFLFKLRNGLMDIEETAAYNVSKKTGDDFTKLKKSYREWTELQKTPMGKQMLDAANNPGKAGSLIKSMVSGDFSWNQLDGFVKTVRKIEKMSGQSGLTSTLRKNIQEGAGEFLLKDNSRELIKLFNTKHALDTLKKLYPEEKNFWGNMENLVKNLPKQKGTGNSVIANMTIARLGGYLGSKTLGNEAGTAAGALGGISLVDKLIDNKMFQNAMIKAYQRQGTRNYGRLSKNVRPWLKGKGYTSEQIDLIEDTIYGLPTAGYFYGGGQEVVEEIKEQTGIKY